jgi:Tol biopolymer transport system component
VAFISDRIKPFHYDVFIMDRDGTNPTALGVTNVSHYNSAPVFMPDGKSVLFLAGTESDAGNRPISSLWQVTAEGKNPRRIAGSDLFTRPLSWKPSP